MDSCIDGIGIGPVDRVATGQIVVEVAADRSVTINTEPVALASLESRLRDIFTARDNRTLFVRGDGSLRYGEIIRVIDAAHGAGVTRVGVVTEGSIAATR